jgi:hypothetical protein
MQPTVAQQLAAIRRIVDTARADLTSDPAATAATAATLELVSGQLRRLERTEANRLAFLVEDNDRTTELLTDLAVLVPALAPPDTGAGDGPGEDVVGARNERLRALLARAVHELPDTPDGDAGRDRIAAHLRRRLDRNPVLNPPRPAPAPDPAASGPAT